MSGYAHRYEDRYAGRTYEDKSTLHKLQESYWTAKQTVKQKLGRKEDACLVASDAQLDAKLEEFQSIQKTSCNLLETLEKYQRRLIALSQMEARMGHFLKMQAKVDNTRAGKMMTAVGKSQLQSSQQRLALRAPLIRLAQEVETFRLRAITDTYITVNRMENARTEYRAALMWMKDVSEELDPDTHKQLEKFRKVQAQVRKTRERFERLKTDVMQKVSLLAASRCNMFSHGLAPYRTSLLQFWHKNAQMVGAVSERFKGYQHYEFGVLRALSETSKRLAAETGGVDESLEDLPVEPADQAEEDPEWFEKMCAQYSGLQALDKPAPRSAPDDGVEALETDTDGLQLVADDDDDVLLGLSDDESRRENGQEERLHSSDSVDNSSNQKTCTEAVDTDSSSRTTDNLIDVETCNANSKDILLLNDSADLLTNPEKQTPDKQTPGTCEAHDLLGVETPSLIELEANTHSPDKEEDVDLSGKLPQRSDEVTADSLLSNEPPLDPDDDDMQLIQKLLASDPTQSPGLTASGAEADEWAALFSDPIDSTPVADPASDLTGAAEGTAEESFLPSHLLGQLGDLSLMPTEQSLGAGGTGAGLMPQLAASQQPARHTQSATRPANTPASQKQDQKQSMSAWFNLFADLDPLANPDAVGRPDGQQNKPSA